MTVSESFCPCFIRMCFKYSMIAGVIGHFQVAVILMKMRVSAMLFKRKLVFFTYE